MSFCELYREGFCRWQKASLKEAPGCAVKLAGKIKKEGEEEPLVPSRCGVYSAMRSQEEIREGQMQYRPTIRLMLNKVPRP